MIDHVISLGRWWVVGSAWTGRETNTISSWRGLTTPTSESWVLDLARKQRMSTDLRKNIFCVLMTSEVGVDTPTHPLYGHDMLSYLCVQDYVDAFEKLVKLGLKEVQEREIVHVLVDCCLQEKTFNQYYAFLAQKLCEFKRSHQVTFQYALWDRLKALESLTAANRANLSKLICHLISHSALSLAVLRVSERRLIIRQALTFSLSLFRLQSLVSWRELELSFIKASYLLCWWRTVRRG